MVELRWVVQEGAPVDVPTVAVTRQAGEEKI
jgi:hypothetical protein